MKAQVTEDAAGLHFEIKDDGSAEYQKAAQLTKEVEERERRGREALREMAESREPKQQSLEPGSESREPAT